MYVYPNIYTHAITIVEKRGFEFEEKEWCVLYGLVGEWGKGKCN